MTLHLEHRATNELDEKPAMNGKFPQLLDIAAISQRVSAGEQLSADEASDLLKAITSLRAGNSRVMQIISETLREEGGRIPGVALSRVAQVQAYLVSAMTNELAETPADDPHTVVEESLRAIADYHASHGPKAQIREQTRLTVYTEGDMKNNIRPASAVLTIDLGSTDSKNFQTNYELIRDAISVACQKAWGAESVKVTSDYEASQKIGVDYRI